MNLIMRDMDMVFLEKDKNREQRGMDNGRSNRFYVRKRNVVLAVFFSLMPVKAIERGVTFEVLLESNNR